MYKKNWVFGVSFAVVAIVAACGILFQRSFERTMEKLFQFLVMNFSWMYLASMLFFVGFSVYMAFGRFGNVKLGDDDSKPEYGNVAWFGMLFGAGMGIGLVFWGVAEPLKHYITFGMTEEAANLAMKKAFMHWGFHPWAAYSVIGLALGYFQHRRKTPGQISSIFLPILGERGVQGPIGRMIDVLSVFATVAGIATSLGQGALQINGGLNYLCGLPVSGISQVFIIMAITAVYTWTAVSGIEKGIKLLSDINMLLAAVLLAGCFLVGPKIMSLNILISAAGSYLNSFVSDSLLINPFGDNSWLGNWTVFYWAWWIAWGPFVGTFIARISKGRTIREFVAGVILAPSITSFVWFSVFGSLGLSRNAETIKNAAGNVETALFVILGEYRMGLVLSVIVILLLCTFFITSANAATFVLAMFSSNGDLNPPNAKKFIWGTAQAILATVLLL
ncbi:MAG: BCCT family transporter, partial [Synergistaceae bacterium]|nr:BCCT family transporter [Synergistaceae bacterium]